MPWLWQQSPGGLLGGGDPQLGLEGGRGRVGSPEQKEQLVLESQTRPVANAVSRSQPIKSGGDDYLYFSQAPQLSVTCRAQLTDNFWDTP